MPAAGLGDWVMFANAARDYKLLPCARKLAFVVGDREKVHAQLAGLLDSIDCLIKIPIEESRRCYIPWIEHTRTMVRDLPFSENVEENFAKTLDASLSYMSRCSSTKIDPGPEVKKWFFDLHRFPIGKTILICPAAGSCGINADTFWLQLAKSLRERGLVPVFNAKDATRYSGFEAIFLSIKDTMAFVELAGGIVTVRSGMADLASYFTSAKVVSLFPDDWEAWSWIVREKWLRMGCDRPSGKFMKAWSLNRIFPRDGIFELVWDENLKIETIVNML